MGLTLQIVPVVLGIVVTMIYHGVLEARAPHSLKRSRTQIRRRKCRPVIPERGSTFRPKSAKSEALMVLALTVFSATIMQLSNSRPLKPIVLGLEAVVREVILVLNQKFRSLLRRELIRALWSPPPRTILTISSYGRALPILSLLDQHGIPAPKNPQYQT